MIAAKKEDTSKKLLDLLRFLEVVGGAKCRVCGGEMQEASSSAEGIKYTCKAAGKEWEQNKFSVRDPSFDHLNRSEFHTARSKYEEGILFAAEQLKKTLKAPPFCLIQ